MVPDLDSRPRESKTVPDRWSMLGLWEEMSCLEPSCSEMDEE